MATDVNGAHSEAGSCRAKVPVDIRILAYFLYAVGFFQLACSVSLITGVGRLGGNEMRRVFFGIVLLSTELDFAIYMFCMGFAHLLCAWELIRINKFGWWFTMIFSLYELIDAVFLFPKHKLVASIGIVIGIVIITWLWFRRQFYKVGLGHSST